MDAIRTVSGAGYHWQRQITQKTHYSDVSPYYRVRALTAVVCARAPASYCCAATGALPRALIIPNFFLAALIR